MSGLELGTLANQADALPTNPPEMVRVCTFVFGSSIGA